MRYRITAALTDEHMSGRFKRMLLIGLACRDKRITQWPTASEMRGPPRARLPDGRHSHALRLFRRRWVGRNAVVLHSRRSPPASGGTLPAIQYGRGVFVRKRPKACASGTVGFHARNAREVPMLLPHALPNHGGSYGWTCASGWTRIVKRTRCRVRGGWLEACRVRRGGCVQKNCTY